ncbi:hypothetical protein [Enterococcus canintestini]|uniref:hypothetical protein n=1 Tax=Enterococcus canintestini TaxID=317010 RepID=UPI003994017B
MKKQEGKITNFKIKKSGVNVFLFCKIPLLSLTIKSGPKLAVRARFNGSTISSVGGKFFDFLPALFYA